MNYIGLIRIIIFITFIIIVYTIYSKYKNWISFGMSEAKRYITYGLTVSWGKTDRLIPIDPINRSYPKEEIPQELANLKRTSIFVAGAPIDINNDGQEAIFIGGGRGKHDALLKYDKKKNKMIDIIDGTNLSDVYPTHAAVSIDLDKDGYSDLFVARQNGVFLYKNNKNSTFTKKLIFAAQKDKVPLALTVSDYNKDGVPDIYISYFIPEHKALYFQFHNKNHSKENVLLQGQKDGTFQDVTKKSGIKNMNNTFTSIFTDINNDDYPDLININDTGQIGFYKNNKGIFEKIKVYDKYGSWMGVTVGDIDFDGDLDYYMSNIGTTIKVSPNTRGNLRSDEILTHDHVLFRNDGQFKMTEVGKEYNLNKSGFSWGAAFADINLDSYLDLLVAQNFRDIPTHKLAPLSGQRWLYNSQTKKYVKTDKYPNPAVSQTPLMVDVDNDQLQDIVWINMLEPAKIYKMENKSKNNFINVKLPDQIEFANAKVYVTANGKTQMREWIIGGIGFASDSSQTIQFGLGKVSKVDSVKVKTIYGKTYEFKNPKINGTIVVMRNKKLKN